MTDEPKIFPRDVRTHEDTVLGDESTDTLTINATTTFASPPTFSAAVTVGEDDTGYDVKFFGATSGAYMLWDESADDLILAGAAGLDVSGTGTLTASGPVVFDGTTATSGAGAVAVTGSIHEITTTGTGDALTLADGVEGQRLVVVYVAEGAGSDTAVLTPSNFGGGTTITFNAVGDCADLIFTNGNWYMIGGTAAVA